MIRSSARWTLAAGCLLAVLASGVSAQSTFSVDPLLVRLNPQANNAVITITNPTSKEIRFEIKAFTWDQTPPNGAMVLKPTTELVIFPPLVSLKPRSTQRVRVGTTAAQGPMEKAYRLMIEELPSGAPPAGVNQVAVRTRVGIPVFIEPSKATVSGRIDSVKIDKRVVAVALTNTGTTHAMVDNIIVRGMAGTDQPVFEDSIQGWYVLAGKSRVWEYTVKPAQCRPSKFVEVEVYANDKVITSRVDMPAGACTAP